MSADAITAAITIGSTLYLYPAVEAAVKEHIPDAKIVQKYSAKDKPTGPTFHFDDYEELDFDRLNSDKEYLACSYVYR